MKNKMEKKSPEARRQKQTEISGSGPTGEIRSWGLSNMENLIEALEGCDTQMILLGRKERLERHELKHLRAVAEAFPFAGSNPATMGRGAVLRRR
jgi:hypothetical protein